MAGYIGSKAVITSGVSASIDELNIIDGVTATTAELNTLDGVTAVVGELNALDIGSTAVGTAVASKAVILDSNKDYTGLRNITLTGELDAGSLDISGNADIDGTLETDALSIAGVAVTTTAAELNLIDGGTARGTTTIVDADGVLVNDAGTMRMTTMATLATYMGTKGLGPTYTRSSTEPSSPNAGDWWLQIAGPTNGAVYIYDATEGWLNNTNYGFGLGYFQRAGSFSVLLAGGKANRLLFEGAGLGGYEEDFTKLISTTTGSGHFALSNSVRGVFSALANTSADTMEFIVMASGNASVDFGNLSVGRGIRPQSTSHATRGIIAGGNSGSVSNVMDYVTIASAGDATDFGNLSVARAQLPSQAMSSTVRSVFGGGNTGSDSNVMDYVTIGSTGNATDFGNTSVTRRDGAAVNNTTRGILAGGTSSGSESNVIDYITIASAGNATDFGDLTISSSSSRVAVHSSTVAFFNTDFSDQITMATAANSTSSGFEIKQTTYNDLSGVIPGWLAYNG